MDRMMEETSELIDHYLQHRRRNNCIVDVLKKGLKSRITPAIPQVVVHYIDLLSVTYNLQK